MRTSIETLELFVNKRYIHEVLCCDITPSVTQAAGLNLEKKKNRSDWILLLSSVSLQLFYGQKIPAVFQSSYYLRKVSTDTVDNGESPCGSDQIHNGSKEVPYRMQRYRIQQHTEAVLKDAIICIPSKAARHYVRDKRRSHISQKKKKKKLLPSRFPLAALIVEATDCEHIQARSDSDRVS